MQLVHEDIRNRDILNWNGVHLFHFFMSSCSQKLRIYLNLKGIEWQPHVVNLSQQENCQPWFLDINPRGLVPVMVLDGAVHIESNDIIKVLEKKFPHPALISADRYRQISEMLDFENSLHLDLRRLSFRFVYGRTESPRSAQCLNSYMTGGSGTIQGQADPHKQLEVAFYQQLNNNGLGNAACRKSVLRFKAAYEDFDRHLRCHDYLLDDQINVLDIAWFVYTYRLCLSGYPFRQLHPRVNRWFEELCQRNMFAAEVKTPPNLLKKIRATRRHQLEAAQTLCDIASF